MFNQNAYIILAALLGVVVLIFLGFSGSSSKEKEAARLADEERERIKNESERLAREKQRQAVEAEKEKRLIDLTERYGAEVAVKIINRQYFIGMTKAQLLESQRREPDSIEKQILKTKTKETWVYGNKSSGDWFVLENDIVVKITDR